MNIEKILFIIVSILLGFSSFSGCSKSGETSMVAIDPGLVSVNASNTAGKKVDPPGSFLRDIIQVKLNVKSADGDMKETSLDLTTYPTAVITGVHAGKGRIFNVTAMVSPGSAHITSGGGC
jgi:hypothetical protein